ncbi:MAG: phosphatase PAP2 family protein [Saccharospirillaceae bacterium]|nr:phosphatase PAP2 family protein [Saccharospirillaceae bacterium]
MRIPLFIFSSFIIFSLSLIFIPSIDLNISSLFFDQTTQSFKPNAFLYFIKELFQSTFPLLFILFVLTFIGIYIKTKQLNRPVLFLICTLVVSAIVIEIVMKGEFGRARPRDIIEFNGDKQFTRAFEVSDQCQKNCSFVSGHAGIGFFFLAFGFIVRKKWAFLPGLALGLLLSYTRIAQGGHFLSDVVIAGFVTFGIAWLNAIYWLKPKIT